MPNNEIRDIEIQIRQLMKKLAKLQQSNRSNEVNNYKFSTLYGETNLVELFGEKDKLLVIHNMGQGCRYCTLWADGFNGFYNILSQLCPWYWSQKTHPKYSVNLLTPEAGDSAWHHTVGVITSRSSP